MYANSLNVVLGLALVYSAVLRPALIGARPQLLFVAAGGILALAWLARRSDHHPWQNNVNMLLGILLAAMAVLQLEHLPLAAFWTQFSVGSAVAVLALWAALYRPSRAAS